MMPPLQTAFRLGVSLADRYSSWRISVAARGQTPATAALCEMVFYQGGIDAGFRAMSGERPLDRRPRSDHHFAVPPQAASLGVVFLPFASWSVPAVIQKKL